MLTFSRTRVSLYFAAGIVASITVACSSSGSEDAASANLKQTTAPTATQTPETPDPEDRPRRARSPSRSGTAGFRSA